MEHRLRADVAEVGSGLTATLLPQLPDCQDDRVQHHIHPGPIAAWCSLLLFSESDVAQASLKLLIFLSPHLSARVTGLHHSRLPQSW